MGDGSDAASLEAAEPIGLADRASRQKSGEGAKTRPGDHKAKHAGDSGKGKSGKSKKKTGTTANHRKTTRKKTKKDEKATLRWLTTSLEHMKSKQERDRKSICLPTCTSLIKFTVLYSCVLLIRCLLGRYMEGILHNLSLLYLLKRPELEFIMGTEKIGFAVSVLLVAYYGNGMHKPLAMLCGTFLCSVGSLVCSVPHFISNVTAIANPEYNAAGLCQTGRNTSSGHQYQCDAHDVRPVATETDVFSILCAGYFIVGVGTALYATLGVIYMEENGNKKQNVLLYGALLSMYGLGDLLGALVSWGVNLLPADITGDISVREWEAGAWWLGFIILGGLLLAVGLFFLSFPKWIREPGWLVKRRQRRVAKYEKLLISELHKLEVKRRKVEKKKRKNKVKANKAEYRKELLRLRAARKDGTDNKAFQNDRDTAPPVPFGQTDVVSQTFPISDPASLELEYRTPNITDVTDTEDTVDQSDSSEEEETNNGGASGYSVPADKHHRNSGDNSNTNNTEEKAMGIDHAAPSAQPAAAKRVAFPEELDAEENAESVKKKEKTDKRKDRLGRNLRDLPRHMVFLFRRPVYMLFLIGTVLYGYQVGGWRATLPAFTRTVFPVSSQPDGPTLMGISYGTASAMGTICGTLVVYRRSLNLVQQAAMLLTSVGVHVVLTAVLMPQTCNPTHLGVAANASSISWKVKCNEQCDCTGVQYEPICNQGGLIFPSSCHAGCREFSSDLPTDPVNQYLRFTDCSCVPDTGEASRGWCDVTCLEAHIFYLVVFFASVAHSVGYISLLLIYLRSVPEKLRSISLGLAVWITFLCAIVPGKAFFTYIQDAACLSKEDDCYEEEVCWFYNQVSLRYLQHGSLMAFQLGAILFFGIAFYLMKKKVYALRPLGISVKGDATVSGNNDQRESDDTAMDDFDNIGYSNDIETGQVNDQGRSQRGQTKNGKENLKRGVNLRPDAPSDDSRM